MFDLANIWLHPCFVCMRWKSVVTMNEYCIGYFCRTLYLVLLCWTHWSRRTAETGSSLLVSGSHLSFPWILVTASYKEARFHYEDIGLCKKYHFYPQVHLNPNCPTSVILALHILVLHSLQKLFKGPPHSYPTLFNAKLLSGVLWESFNLCQGYSG